MRFTAFSLALLMTQLSLTLLFAVPPTTPKGDKHNNAQHTSIPSVPEPQRHLEGDPTHSSNPLQWVEISPEQEKEFYFYLRGIESASLPVDREDEGVQQIIKRIEKWVARLHTSVGATSPAPKIVLIPDSVPNAWVTSIPVCLQAKLEIVQESGRSAPGKLIERAIFTPESNISEKEPLPPVFGGNPNQKDCLDTPSPIQLEAFIAYYNQTSQHCKLSLKGTDTLLAKGKACLSPDQTFGSAKKTAFIAVPDRIMVTTGLLRMFAKAATPEAPADAQLASVLAHEMGHYYRAHPVHRSRYDFFYQQTQKPDPIRPKATADSKELNQKMQTFLGGRPPVIVPGQKHTPQATQFLVNDIAQGFLVEFCSSKEGEADWNRCPVECKKASESAGQFDRNTINSGYLNKEHHQQYLDFEKELDTCLKAVRMVQPTNAVASAKLVAQLKNTAKIQFPWLTKSIRVTRTLADFMREVDNQNIAHDKNAKAFFDELTSRNLGWYTAEQEADEFSLEHLTNIGISPKSAIEAEFAFGREKQKHFPIEVWIRNHGVPMDKLQTLMKNGWIDNETHKYTYIPIGNFVDPHHGTPYRIFDMDREISAHQYIDRLKVEKYPEYAENWQEIDKIAERLENVPVPQFSWNPQREIKRKVPTFLRKDVSPK